MKVGDLVKTRRDPWNRTGIVIELGEYCVTVRWACGTVQEVGYLSTLEVISESR